jgi:hypothetical protein
MDLEKKKKKSKLNSGQIWILWKKNRLNSEMIWKNMEERQVE